MNCIARVLKSQPDFGLGCGNKWVENEDMSSFLVLGYIRTWIHVILNTCILSESRTWIHLYLDTHFFFFIPETCIQVREPNGSKRLKMCSVKFM